MSGWTKVLIMHPEQWFPRPSSGGVAAPKSSRTPTNFKKLSKIERNRAKFHLHPPNFDCYPLKLNILAESWEGNPGYGPESLHHNDMLPVCLFFFSVSTFHIKYSDFPHPNPGHRIEKSYRATWNKVLSGTRIDCKLL